MSKNRNRHRGSAPTPKLIHSPPNGFADLSRSANNSRRSISIVTVPDPYEKAAQVRAIARLDLLDRERRRGRLEEAAYQAGRELERHLERWAAMGSSGSWAEGDRIDAATAHDNAIESSMEAAYRSSKFLGFVVEAVGRRDARMLTRVLGDGLTYEKAALAEGNAGNRARRKLGRRFRSSLGRIADRKAARGRARR